MATSHQRLSIREDTMMKTAPLTPRPYATVGAAYPVPASSRLGAPRTFLTVD